MQNAQTLGVRRIIGVGRGVDDLKCVAGLGAETVELTGDRDPDAAAIAARTTSKATTPFRRAPR
ncbi:hypothetical protein [Nonomuraea jabiensis]|uniref:Uncharacterized protein n=1 Tax=Nonomuraea jabiensis TaxID=882448 RepID=A0A7W9FYQ9_9ACTN|nr:hypothetical protein [Nonomuraea jabiensis]MBB5773964.1 hypothetical protein [Nonomuraea jabiensis]